MNKPLNKKLLNQNDLIDINELLQSDISIINSLDIIKNNDNKSIIESIKDKMNKGLLIEDFIIEYTSNKFKIYFNSFKSFISVITSFNLTTNIINKEKILKDNLISNLRYPLLLLFTTIISIICFYILAFDNLINFSLTFNQDITLIYKIRFISLSIVYTLIFIILIILIIYLYIIFNNKQVLLYVFICNYIPINIIKEYLSYQFIIFYKQCLLVDLKPYETLKILKSINNKPIVSYFAYLINDSLDKGNDLNESVNNKYIDKRLYRFINLSLYTNNILNLLNVYLDNSEKKFKSYFNKITKFIQLFSYLMIGLLIILVYQIILMPLEIIGGF